MKQDLIIYHGSQQIVEVPQFGIGKTYNDYGQGFYCTESIALAKEWACPVKNNGYSTKYIMHFDGLNTMHLTKGTFHILNWLAILLSNRKFDITSPVGNQAREFILARFLPNTDHVDVMIGYRADDSYFSFAEDFVNNTISLRDLNLAMQLGTLGEQVVLLSKRSFEQIEFVEYEYYYKRAERDHNARTAYKNHKKNLQQLLNDVFVLDIMREDMQHDDPRLQSVISE